MEIIYHDEFLIAVNKPAGMLVHRTPLDPKESRCVMLTLRDQIDRWVYPVHRLDKGTSGVLLFALDPGTAASVSFQFGTGTFRKTYQAVIRGYIDETGTIDYAVPQGKKLVLRPSVTHYKRLDQCELPHPVGIFETARYSWVQANPNSGRRHQIRRHFKHLRHPIIGDRLYGDRDHNRFFRDQLGIESMLLHSVSLSLFHPVHGDELSIHADHPEEWRKVLEILNWSE